MVKREIFEKLVKYLWKDKIMILKWARQVGKTTLMKELIEYIEKSNKPNVDYFFVSADDIYNQDILQTPEHLVKHIKTNHKFPKKFVYIFIDEFQYIKNAWLFLKNIFDKYKWQLQLIVSGSSSLEITKNTEFLTGRHISFLINKINYFEFCRYKLGNVWYIWLDNWDDLKSMYEIRKTRLNDIFLEYIRFGWYPEIIILDDKQEKVDSLKSIFNTYIQKDIVHFLKIQNISWFNNLVKILSSQIWNLVNKSEISNTIWLDNITTTKYLDILQWTFVFSLLHPYYKNVRKEISKMPKIYIEDFWIRNISLWEIDTITSKIDIWDIAENFVYSILRERYDNIFFYRTKSWTEIDFIVENTYTDLDIIEVKYRRKVSIPDIFNTFENNYSNTWKKIIITKDILKKQWNIYFIPITIVWFVLLK